MSSLSTQNKPGALPIVFWTPCEPGPLSFVCCSASPPGLTTLVFFFFLHFYNIPACFGLRAFADAVSCYHCLDSFPPGTVKFTSKVITLERLILRPYPLVLLYLSSLLSVISCISMCLQGVLFIARQHSCSSLDSDQCFTQ